MFTTPLPKPAESAHLRPFDRVRVGCLDGTVTPMTGGLWATSAGTFRVVFDHASPPVAWCRRSDITVT